MNSSTQGAKTITLKKATAQKSTLELPCAIWINDCSGNGMPNLSQTVFDNQLIANEQIMHRTNRMACVLYANWNDSFGSSHSTVRRHPFRSAMRRRPMIAANGVVN